MPKRVGLSWKKKCIVGIFTSDPEKCTDWYIDMSPGDLGTVELCPS